MSPSRASLVQRQVKVEALAAAADAVHLRVFKDKARAETVVVVVHFAAGDEQFGFVVDEEVGALGVVCDGDFEVAGVFLLDDGEVVGLAVAAFVFEGEAEVFVALADGGELGG